MRGWVVGVVAVAAALGITGGSAAEPVAVRFTEGVTRAFPVLKNADGEPLARGDLVQVARGDRVENRLVFRFRDGSLHDEAVVFSQQDTFRLLSYRIVQRGPSFPETLEASIDRATGRYEVRYRADDDSPEEHLTGTFDMPDDVYNGLLGLVLKNLPRRPQTVSLVAFTPRPRVVKLALLPVAEESVTVGGAALPAVRWHIRPQLGLFASLLVADIPDMRVWVLPGEAPAFLRAEGPLYFMGPVWRIEPN